MLVATCLSAESADMTSRNRSDQQWVLVETAALCHTPSRVAAHKALFNHRKNSSHSCCESSGIQWQTCQQSSYSSSHVNSSLNRAPAQTLLFHQTLPSAKTSISWRATGKSEETQEDENTTAGFGSVICAEKDVGWVHFSRGAQPVSSGNLDSLQLHARNTLSRQTGEKLLWISST